jgi:hypothetical protein
MQEAGGQLLDLDFLVWQTRAGLLQLGGSGGSSSAPSLLAVRLVVSESTEIANTAEEMAEGKSETLVTLIPVFLPLVGLVPRSFPGFLSCQCLASSAAENLAYTSSGICLFLTVVSDPEGHEFKSGHSQLVDR